MKKWTIFGSLLVVVFLLGACNSAASLDEIRAAADGDESGTTLAEADAETDDSAIAAEPTLELTSEEREEKFGAELAAYETTADGIQIGFTADGHAYYGDPEAPIVIEEFSDYQCPYCSRFAAETFPSIKANAVANGEAVIIYYDYPLNFHPQAAPAANAARCAGETSAAAYWDMHDWLFANPDVWGNNSANEAFIAYAAEAGLDTEEFATCVNEGRYMERVEADFALGQQRGVTGTPSFFINNQMLVGALPISAFDNAIAQIKAGETIPDPRAAEAQEVPDIPPFEMPEPAELSRATTPLKGDASAPITIVEFSDYQCPFCNRHTQETLPQIVAELVDSGRVNYEFKDFPLEAIHPEARAASIAARCAAEQDGYWDMHDVLFASQERWSGQPDINGVLAAIGGEIGLDAAALEECLAEGRYDAEVQADLDEGFALGVTGTPAFFINGYGISGARPYDLFELIVEAIENDTLEDLYRDAYDAQVEALKAQQQAQQVPQAPPPPSEPVDVPTEGWPTIGDPDAPITIVEYTDYQCPYCGRHFADTFPQIEENFVNQGLVRYVFKDYPLDFHPQAPIASAAARCADDQGAFKAMHDVLFERQGEWSGRSDAAELFIGYGADLGLDTDALRQCIESGTYDEAIAADLQEGFSVGVTGTPSFLINGNLVVGALPYANFEQAINAMLDGE